MQSKKDIYDKIKNHWSSQPSSVESVLNGFGELNKPDIEFSNKLLERLINSNMINTEKVLDCAAGVGRVSEYVLVNHFKQVDMFEQEEKFVNEAKQKFKNNSRVCSITCSSIQDYNFNNVKYDLIWMQWCLENISDSDLVIFMKKSYKALNEKGLIIVKENCLNKTAKEKYHYTEDTLAKERRLSTYIKLFNKSGFKIIEKGINDNWPSEFYPLHYFILKKKKNK